MSDRRGARDRKRLPDLARQTIVDRVVGLFSPQAQLDRVVTRTRLQAMSTWGGGSFMAGGYEGGNMSRRALFTWGPRAGSGAADTLPQLVHLRAACRDLDRNTPIATAAATRSTTMVVGQGLRPKAMIDRDYLGLSDEAADAWERDAERAFRVWSESQNSDATRTQAFTGLQELAFRSVFTSGDAFAVLKRRDRGGVSPLALALYEADQVSNPHHAPDGALLDNGNRVYGGVEVDADGAPEAYWIRNHHPGGLVVEKDEWDRVPARGARSGRPNVLHLYRRLRIGQPRGVPELAPVIEKLKQLGDYTTAELFAAVIGAMITVVNKSPGAAPLAPNEIQKPGSGGSVVHDDVEMRPGTVLDLDSESEVTVPTLGRPNSGFDGFFVAIVRQIGAALELPFEVLLMHFTSSYSASRAALEMAWQQFRVRRAWLAARFCQPCYEEVIADAVAAGVLSAPGFFADPMARVAWLGTRWIGPGRMSLDPAREFQAYATAEDRGWKTAMENTAEISGGDWEANHTERMREERARREAGMVLQPVRGGRAAAPPARDEDEGDEE